MLIRCPHCAEEAMIRTSRDLSSTVRELYLQCKNLECAHTWRAFITAISTIAPSMTPDPTVCLPLSPRSPAAQPPEGAQMGLALDCPPHPRAMAPNTS